ncbi:MAG: alpha/beta fold hydrolase [Candidatus Rokuibacteriota bacterium]
MAGWVVLARCCPPAPRRRARHGRHYPDRPRRARRLAHAAVGLDTHIEDVVGALVYEDLHDVFLVGHSYGGVVITAAAARVRERLRGLVYLDAPVPENGLSNNDVLPPRIGGIVRERAREGGDGWRVPPPSAIDWGLDDGTRAWVVPKLTPHPLKSLEDPARLHAGALAALPRAFLRTSLSSATYQPLFERARAEGWLCQELDGGHYAMLTAPHVVATELLELADARGPGGTRQARRPMADPSFPRGIRFDGQVAVVTGPAAGSAPPMPGCSQPAGHRLWCTTLGSRPTAAVSTRRWPTPWCRRS